MNTPGNIAGHSANIARLAGGLAALALLLTGCSGGGAPQDEDGGAATLPSPLATAHAVPRSEPSAAAGPEDPTDRDDATAEPTREDVPTPAAPTPEPRPTRVPTPSAAPAPPAELPDSFCAFPDPTMNAVCRSALGR